MEHEDPVTGFYAPVHRALTEPVLLGGELIFRSRARLPAWADRWLPGAAITVVAHVRTRKKRSHCVRMREVKFDAVESCIASASCGIGEQSRQLGR